MLNARVQHPQPTPVRAVSDAAITAIADLLSRRTGQQLASSRVWRIDSVLQPLVRARGYRGLDQLVADLPVDGSGPLVGAVIDALLNQETSFYRDSGVVELVARFLADQRAAEPTRRLRLWSAGCSTGQEPLSLAMSLAGPRGAVREMPDIVATDVSDGALARARSGSFSQFEIQRGLPVRQMLEWFEHDGADWIARPELIRLVSFRRHNLVSEPPPYGAFDMILCRNVLLYFPATVRTMVFERLAGALRPGGLLMLGAGETTIGQTALFKPSRTYRGAYELAAAD